MPAKKKREEMTPEEQRDERIAEARRANENRNQQMLDRRSAIADSVDELRDDDMDDVDGDTIVPRNKKTKTAEEQEEEAAEEDARAERERERLAAQEGPDDPEDDDERDDDDEGGDGDSKIINGVRHYLQIVNGKQKWQTLQQIRTSAQKVESADEYLQGAAASVRNAAKLGEAESDTEDDEEDDSDLEAMVNKALLGDQESVKQLARRIKATPSRVTPDVLQAVDERLTFRAAVDWFESEFEPELADPMLKRLIVEEDAKLASENPTWSYRKRLKKAGETIREWQQGMSGTKGNNERRATKEQRKRQMTSVPGAGGRQREEQNDDAEETVESQIQAMARARHQGRSIKH